MFGFCTMGHRNKITTSFWVPAKTSPKKPFKLVFKRPVERLLEGRSEEGKHNKTWEKSMEEKIGHTKEIMTGICTALIGYEAGELDRAIYNFAQQSLELINQKWCALFVLWNNLMENLLEKITFTTVWVTDWKWRNLWQSSLESITIMGLLQVSMETTRHEELFSNRARNIMWSFLVWKKTPTSRLLDMFPKYKVSILVNSCYRSSLESWRWPFMKNVDHKI